MPNTLNRHQRFAYVKNTARAELSQEMMACATKWIKLYCGERELADAAGQLRPVIRRDHGRFNMMVPVAAMSEESAF